MVIILLVQEKRKVEGAIQALMLEATSVLNLLQPQRVLAFSGIRGPVDMADTFGGPSIPTNHPVALYRQLQVPEPFSGNATFLPGMRSPTYNDSTNLNHDFMSSN